MWAILQLLALLLLFISILSFFNGKVLKLVLLFVLMSFFIVELGSCLIGGSVIDMKFFQHFTWEILYESKLIFLRESVVVLSITLVVSYLVFRLSSGDYFKRLSRLTKCTSCSASLIVMNLHGGALSNLVEYVNMQTATLESDFDKAIGAVNVKGLTYVQKEDLRVEKLNEKDFKPKNILVISLESFEKGFLSAKFAHLTPNLRKLSKEMTFFNMDMSVGSSWTSGSLYTMLTGFPCIFRKPSNQTFQGIYNTKLPSIGHIFKMAGYEMTYLIAWSTFGGFKDLARLNKFSVVSDSEMSQYPDKSGWGTYDKDFFNEARNIIRSNKSLNQPFALFMHTMGTHPPDGVYDKRMEKKVKKEKEDLHFMVAATDYHIGEIIKFLKEEKLYDDTAIYIFPDHLLMANYSDMEQSTEKRSLYLMTNVPKEKLTYSPSKTLSQIDLAKLIVEGVGVKHNVKFLTDLIGDQDKVKYISDHKLEILAINESSLTFKSALKRGQSLRFDDRLHSSSGNYALDLDLGCLTLYKNMKPLWYSKGEREGYKLHFEDNGELVLRDRNNSPIWIAPTGGLKGETLFIDDADGVLKMLDKDDHVIWVSHVNRYILKTGESLLNTKNIISKDLKYRLVLQNDGNLVVYNDKGNAAWQTNTDGYGLLKLTMESDKLALYDREQKVVWKQEFGQIEDPELLVGDDGIPYVASKSTKNIFKLDNPDYILIPEERVY